jgi:hypothetical protein
VAIGVDVIKGIVLLPPFGDVGHDDGADPIVVNGVNVYVVLPVDDVDSDDELPSMTTAAVAVAAAADDGDAGNGSE